MTTTTFGPRAAGAVTAPGRLRRAAFPVMGTVASLAVRCPASVFDEAQRVVARILGDAEERFSPFRRNSELVRLRRGFVAPDDVSPEMREVLAACRSLEELTDGAFRWIDPSGRIDPTGYVKGWAIGRAGERLDALGLDCWLLGVGGDYECRGGHGDRPWRVAVRHPDGPHVVAHVIQVFDGAVATSGDYERGAHVWSANGRAVRRRGCCTVVGPRIEWADALATAVWARGGEEAMRLLHRAPGYTALVMEDGSSRMAEGFPLLTPSRGATDRADSRHDG